MTPSRRRPGEATFFPPLPASSAVDATVAWQLPYTQPEGGTLPPLVAVARVDGHLDVAGVPALVLTIAWQYDPVDRPKHSEPDVGATTSVTTGRAAGLYVILATGRLLYAVVRGFEANETATGAGKPDSFHADETRELRLVSACDGPVLPAPVRTCEPVRFGGADVADDVADDERPDARPWPRKRSSSRHRTDDARRSPR